MNFSVVPYLCSCCGCEINVQYGGAKLIRCSQCGYSSCSGCTQEGVCLCCRGRTEGWRPGVLDKLRGRTPPKVDPLSLINTQVWLLIDRPLGSQHPSHGHYYSINYGYVPGTLSGDGQPLDAYVLGVDYAIRRFDGIVIAVIERAEEDDPKLIVVPKGQNYTDEEILAATHFQEQHFTVTVRRGQS